MEVLEDDTLLAVLHCLGPLDLARCARACKRLRNLSYRQELWHQM